MLKKQKNVLAVQYMIGNLIGNLRAKSQKKRLARAQLAFSPKSTDKSEFLKYWLCDIFYFSINKLRGLKPLTIS